MANYGKITRRQLNNSVGRRTPAENTLQPTWRNPSRKLDRHTTDNTESLQAEEENRVTTHHKVIAAKYSVNKNNIT